MKIANVTLLLTDAIVEVEKNGRVPRIERTSYE